MSSKIKGFYSKNKEFLTELVIITLSKYYKQGLLFIKGLLLAKYLSVEEFGVYGLFLIFLTFSAVISFGSTYSLNKKLSLDNNLNDSKIIINRSFVILLLSNFVFLLLFLFVLINLDTAFGRSFILVYLIIVLQQINLFYENILRALQRFKKISVGLFILSTIDIVLIIALLNNINVNWVLLFYFISVVVTNLYYVVVTREVISLTGLFKYLLEIKSDRIELSKHFLLGVSLLFYNLNYLLSINVDKIVVNVAYGVESLGIYTFATNIVAGTLVLLQGLNYITYPKLLNKFSSIISYNLAVRFYMKMMSFIVPLILFVNIFVFFIATNLISNLYEDYTNAISIILILLIGQIFNIITLYSNTISIALNQESVLIKLQLISLFLNIMLSLYFASIGSELIFIAIATSISQIILCILSVLNTFKAIKTIK